MSRHCTPPRSTARTDETTLRIDESAPWTEAGYGRECVDRVTGKLPGAKEGAQRLALVLWGKLQSGRQSVFCGEQGNGAGKVGQAFHLQQDSSGRKEGTDWGKAQKTTGITLPRPFCLTYINKNTFLGKKRRKDLTCMGKMSYLCSVKEKNMAPHVVKHIANSLKVLNSVVSFSLV